mgnify:CR=1 FL=1
MPRVKKEKKDLRTKFDKIRQDDQKALGLVKESTKRPVTASSVMTVQECEKWRSGIVKEIFGRVERINDRKKAIIFEFNSIFFASNSG